MAVIDLNADLGESFGAYRIGHDDQMLEIVSSANVACGFHGGDPLVMHDTLVSAAKHGVGIGAHPGFNDLWGFGRRQIRVGDVSEIEKMLVYQIGAIQGMARATGTEVTHFKLHGALSNMACTDAGLAMAAARAVKAMAPELVFVVLPRSELEKAGEIAGLRMAREVFADRAYDDDGMLVPRGTEGAMIHDAAVAGPRILRFLEQGALESLSGKRIPVQIDTVCVHGDSPGAVAIARDLRQQFERAGLDIVPMHQTLA